MPSFIASIKNRIALPHESTHKEVSLSSSAPMTGALPLSSGMNAAVPENKTLRGRLTKMLRSEQAGQRIALPSSERIAKYMCPPGVKETNLRKILPQSQFVEIPLKSVPGNVVWLNWDMLEEIDPSLKSCNRVISADFEKQILHRYCKIKSDEHHSNGSRGYADRYRTYYGPEHGGSGRLAILEGGESLKGVGPTPLAPAKYGDHSDGLAGIEEAVLEASAGEARAHLSKEKNKTTRVLAIIAPQLEWSIPGQEAQPMLIVRVGVNVRPAHFTLGRGFWPNGSDLKKLEDASEKMFVEGRSALAPEILLRQHARTAANLSRWRIEHGSINESNLTLDGSSLDYGTFTTQPYSAPLHALKASVMAGGAWMEPMMTNAQIFGAEHKMPPAVMAPLLNANTAWQKIYKEENNVETLSSLGLPREAVHGLMERRPAEAALLAKHVRFLGRLFYNNHSSDSRDNWDEASTSSVVDKHSFLARLPDIFFDRHSGKSKTVTDENLTKELDVLPQSFAMGLDHWRSRLAINKYAVDSAEVGLQRMKPSLGVIAAFYPELILNVAEHGLQQGMWDSLTDCLNNVAARAKRENMPLESLFAPVLRGKVKTAINSYEDNIDKSDSGRDRDVSKNALFSCIANIIDETISDSKRRVDDSLFNSPAEKGELPGTYYLQKQKINGILYYLEAHVNGSRHLCVESGAPRSDRTSTLQKGNRNTQLFKYAVKPYDYETLDGEFIIGQQTINLKDQAVKYSYCVPNKHELNQIILKHGLS
ncbi:MAG: hypothetical protein ACRYGK_01515 [Janthinobacterium lividum]